MIRLKLKVILRPYKLKFFEKQIQYFMATIVLLYAAIFLFVSLSRDEGKQKGFPLLSSLFNLGFCNNQKET